MPTALITGITGQDGSYLAELLLSKGYDVVGAHRRSSTVTFERIAHLVDKITLVTADLLDESSLMRVLREHKPSEVYNLAAQSFVMTSWAQPVLTGEVTARGVTRLLDAILMTAPTITFSPRSPYGVAKVYGHWATVNYRESYDMHASSGILFNHESPRRGLEFVTRKVTHAVASIKLGLSDHVDLGTLDSQRDWGYAPDFVRAMWMMLQQDVPSDFVVASGETHSVRELCELAFGAADLNWQDHVVVDEKFMRPAEVDLLVGDPTRAKEVLGWKRDVDFPALVAMMVEADLASLRSQLR